ncbi:MAG: hypothetical protein ACR2JC_09190 [Chloroflexota bacterium]
MNDLTSTRSARIPQGIWLALSTAGTALWLGAPASQWMTLQTACYPDSACVSFQLDASAARSLAEHGISLGGYAAYIAVILAAVWVIWYGLAGLIIWRKPRDRGAVLAAYFLVLFPLTIGASVWTSSNALSQALYTALPVALLLYALLFPDGRFAPRWTRWLAASAVLALILNVLPPIAASGFWLIPVVLLPIAVAGAQIYRFRHISSWIQRQQTKWALFGLVVAILGFVALTLSFLFVPKHQTAASGSLYQDFTFTGFLIVTAAVPISIGIAVLRSQLWDIDRIISRTLVYLSLTVSLGLLYLGSVVGLQALFRAITGQQSNLAIAISTLVIAAVFNPLRHRIQAIIARTFYRSRYDAAQVLAAFGATCRDETDLAKLHGGLERVVEETLRPAHVSLWLRETLPGLDKI